MEPLSKREGTSNLPHLPSDALTEILSRLPLKTLVAARFVCKSWLNLVSGDTHLAKLHRRRSPTTELLLRPAVNHSRASASLYSGNFRTFVGKNRGRVYEVNPSLLLNLPRFDITSNNTIIWGKKRKNNLIFANSCHELLCFHSFDSGFAMIINPITTEFITVPMREKWSSEIIPTVNYRLGFSEKKNRFKLLRVMYNPNSPKQFAEICTFEKGSHWRNVRACPYPIRQSVGLESVIVEHNLHYDFAGSGIACFDFEKERFGVVPIPSQDCNASDSLFGVFRGCLSLSWRPLGAVSHEMWVMKEYGVGDSWEKVFSIRFGDIPLKQLENGDILMLYERKCIVSYNPSSCRAIMVWYDHRFSELRAYSPTPYRLKEAMAGYKACIHDVNSRRRICEESNKKPKGFHSRS